MFAPVSFLSFRLCCSGRRGQLLKDTSHEEACWTTTPHLTSIPNSAVFKIGSRLAAGMCESRGGEFMGRGQPSASVLGDQLVFHWDPAGFLL